MKVLWNLQEGSPGKLLKWHFHGDSELLPGVFFNGRTTKKNRGFAHWKTWALQTSNCPSCAASAALEWGKHAVTHSSTPKGSSSSRGVNKRNNNNCGPLFQVHRRNTGKGLFLVFWDKPVGFTIQWGWTHLVIRLRVRFGSWYIGCNQDFGRFCHTNFRYLKWRYLKPV